MDNAIAVVVVICLRIKEFRAETEVEQRGGAAGGIEGTEGAVFEGGDHPARGVQVLAIVTVAVVEWIVFCAADAAAEQAADSSGSLRSATEIRAPDVGPLQGAALVFGDEVPAVIDIPSGHPSSGLLDAAAHGVVAILHGS